MGLPGSINPIRQLDESFDDLSGDITQQYDDIRKGDFRKSIDDQFNDWTEQWTKSNILPGIPIDIDDGTLSNWWQGLEKAVGDYDWSYWGDMLSGLGGSGVPGGEGGGPWDFPETEKRHTGGPSSGDFYMDIYSGGLEGGNIAGKKYGLAAPENANYRGVLGVY